MLPRENKQETYKLYSDGELTTCSLNGDEEAFEVLVKRYNTPIYNYLYHILGDYDQTNDVLQQVMIQLYLSLSLLRRDKPIKAWLFQVAHNQMIDELRKRRPLFFSQMEYSEEDEELLQTLIETANVPEIQAEYKELRQRLRQAIQALPLHFQSIVVLRYQAQLTFKEIGQLVGIPEATAKTYFQRAKPRIRQALQEASLYDLLPGY